MQFYSGPLSSSAGSVGDFGAAACTKETCDCDRSGQKMVGGKGAAGRYCRYRGIPLRHRNLVL
jgi:hypothetical protein